MSHSIAEPVVHREHWRDADDDRPRLECGVCGVWGAEPNAASSVVALGLHALQHRGQEACGIASVHEARFEAGRWRTVPDSRYGRRITADTPFRIKGPAAGHASMRRDVTGKVGSGRSSCMSCSFSLIRASVIDKIQCQ